ncbi:MAG: UDP-N-acetylenolpyruvoylglucosamine reductase [uncultured bacterium]|nr:MAG: UDP-N-acetylenolpyruvoylglucosamine reductase [uncultured bacterium]OGT09647.1 MAG: UDP-N-acetylenolpyruvoylglucosamine reductase [Gammaproteobacteria bacterium RBG_16_37_9]HBC71718.1 UDP-N-acetylenolpyruvoylglucosamine reductase [Coxiellaceae bacterium]HBY55704.1 UDP-N-acetylenolpyruvoylglucosamine reductase [Coxiellaceae bacterium]
MNKDLSKLKNKLQRNHPLAEYTSWKIGGPAEYFYRPMDLEDLVQIMRVWQEEPIMVLGAASNVLIRDAGIKGLVIYLRNSLTKFDELDDSNIRVEAGVELMHLVEKCVSLGMFDAAFMSGIPGTVGGALKMNAGAYGERIWNHIVAVETINRSGEIKLKQAKDFAVGYRQVDSLAKDEWFVAAQFNFTRGEVQAAKQQVQTYLQKRSKSQPLDFPSCGSVFRNPEGDYAARLIEACGLKGKQIGGARVSEKHANFIINCGNAIAVDVETLMQEIITKVESSSSVKLIPEVHILGDILLA